MKYTPTIGIECHVQLKTKTKLFSAVGNDARDAKPNALISHIDVGMPGALPVLNRAAIELSARAAFALNTQPQKSSFFERKHYFYPDLPKGYQITQYQSSIITGGYLEFMLAGQTKRINIERANLEEDAGKNTHPAGADYSLVDLNRAGTPLLEIVSMPELHSAAEAKAYAREMWLTMKYAGVTDGDLYHGHVRFDVNVSLSADPKKLGTRAEIKNLNSFRSVEGAVEYEIKRQTELLDKGEKVIQETRGWDEAKQQTVSQRGKEEAHDYRYMPEPDVPPLELDDAFISEIKKDMPQLPPQIREILSKLDFAPNVIEDIVVQPYIAAHLERLLRVASADDVRSIAFWMLQVVPPGGDEGVNAARILVEDEKLIKLSQMVSTGKLSSTAGREIFIELLKTKGDPEEIAIEKNLMQLSDEGEIEKIVAEVLKENAKAAEDVKNGEMKAIGFLVGQVMAKSKGQANPGMAQELIKKQLGIS